MIVVRGTWAQISKNLWLAGALLPLAAMIFGFELLPIMGMLIDSFRADDGNVWTLGQYITALKNPYYLVAIKNSLLISLLSSFIAIVAAAFVAYFITRLKPKSQEAVLTYVNLTANFAGVPLAFAYIIMLGNSGLFTILFQRWGLDIFSEFDLYSWSGLVLIYVYFQLPLAILLLYPIYFEIKEQWREAAHLLGASDMQFWLQVGLPIIMPGLVGTFSILFANAMGAYATAYALVGSNYNLLSVRIGALISGDVYARPHLASALAMLLALSLIAAMLTNEYMMRRIRRDLK